MRKRVKRILSLCLAVVIMATSAGYLPPVVGAATATPSTATPITENMATPSEAIPSEEKSTPSEATPSEGKSTPSEAEKKFIRVDPEEIPEYYSRESKSGMKLWKFEDRNGNIQYRDYGFIQGEAEFPLWYVADQTGTVEDLSASVNLDEEYYSLAPYVYQSVTPDKSAWADLSWRLLYDEDSIFSCERKESGKFNNWDGSTYAVWSICGPQEDDDKEEEVDLGYYFYGSIFNERNSTEEWYYADNDGNVWSMSNMLTAKLALAASTYSVKRWFDIPGQFRTINPSNVYNTSDDTYNMVNLFDYGNHFNDEKVQEIINFTSNFVGWSTYRSNDNSIGVIDGANNYVDVQGDPVRVSKYFTGGTFYPSNYTVNLDKIYKTEFYGIWCPKNADMYIFAGERYKGDPAYTEYSIHSIIVRRNNSFSMDLVGEITKQGYTFNGWRYNPSGTAVEIPSDGSLSCGSSGKVTWVYPNLTANENTITFVDPEGNVLKEEKVYSGNSATPPEVPIIEGYKFVGWDKSYNNVVSDMVITAQYKATNQLTIIANGGTVYGNETWSTEIPIGTYTTSTIADAKTNSVREGYTFQSWYYYDEEGNEKSGYPTLLTSDLTIYIKWKANLYTMTFNANVTDGSVSNTSRSKYYGDLMGELPILTRKNYKFLGWFTSAYNDEQITSETPVPAKNTTYYAHWEFHYVDITYDDCIPDSTWSDSAHVWVGATSLYNSLPKLTRDGYVLNGWCTEPDGKGDRVVYNWTIPQVDTLTLYAWWVPKTTYIYYMKNLSSSDNTYYSSVKTQYGAEIGEMPNVTEDGKVFLGWYTEREGGEKVSSVSTVGLPVEDYKYYLYAHWGKNSNTVSYRDWNGTILDEQTITFGTDATPPADPTRTGYTFTGWDKPSTNIQVDTVITAQYSINSYQMQRCRWHRPGPGIHLQAGISPPPIFRQIP